MNTVPARAQELVAGRLPFVRATVVRAQVPASAHPGDAAIVLADGTVEGFVGGQCAEGSVRTAALGTLRDGESLLLRVLPESEQGFPDSPGARVVVNPCLSGGALEIFLEPILPPPLVGVLGDTPIADAVVSIAAVLGWSTTRSVPDAGAEGVAALVVATHGRNEHTAVQAALDAGVGYVAVVASRRRGSALLDELGLTMDERARVHTPAGLDIGARTAPEVAVSILAEVIAAVRTRSLAAPEHTGPEHTGRESDAPQEVLDPVCGMTVTAMASTPQLVVDGETVWFCGTGCRDHHALLVAQG